jgi:hypothetical protein
MSFGEQNNSMAITYSFSKLYKDIGAAHPAVNPHISLLAIFFEGGCIRRIIEVFANQTENCRCDMCVNNLE